METYSKIRTYITLSENLNFKNCVQLCSYLALIQTYDIEIAWESISILWPEDNMNALELKDYIYNTWLSNRNETLFSRQTWNHYGILRRRTNNSAEGFHSKLNKKINKYTASFWEIGTVIKSIQIQSEFELRRLLGGGRPKSRKKIYVLYE
ncbi:hypothetical protein DMUE_0796 [Dictyocoela muelleri]|nr:hypothetical protein DMUE_0796 [Dictyocoela muelleri]